MFGIDDDNNQPAAAPAPPPNGPPAPANPVNPISGNETLGPPQVSAGLPSIIPGAGGSSPLPGIVKKSQPMATTPPAGDTMSAALPTPAAPPPNMSLPALPLPEPLTANPKPKLATPPSPDLPDGAEDELLEIKKEALQSLMPLVDELDQPPPEKFKTIMMLLQASDNPHLVKEAYETANKIPDEKAKAQALLDVVNEINYFTHPENPVDKPKN